jgi:hypothetical protein
MSSTSATADWFVLPPSPVQARVLELVDTYVQTFKRPCPGAVVADALGVHRTTVSQHLAALYRKGWLRAEGAPAVPKRPFLDRSA